MAHTLLTVREMVAHCDLITLKRLRKPNFSEAGEEAVVFLMKKVSQLKIDLQLSLMRLSMMRNSFLKFLGIT